eukprot:2215505-Pleurochrysis_carterae.AAC.3
MGCSAVRGTVQLQWWPTQGVLSASARAGCSDGILTEALNCKTAKKPEKACFSTFEESGCQICR